MVTYGHRFAAAFSIKSSVFQAKSSHDRELFFMVERFSYDLEMKAHEQNRNNKRTEIERFDWFIERTDKRTWLFIGLANAQVKKLHARELSRNQPILRFDVILQHDWPIEQCLLHIRVSLAGKRRGHVLIFSSIG